MVEIEKIVENWRMKNLEEYGQTRERLVDEHIFVPTSSQRVGQWIRVRRIEVIVVEQLVLGLGGFVAFFGGHGINSQ